MYICVYIIYNTYKQNIIRIYILYTQYIYTIYKCKTLFVFVCVNLTEIICLKGHCLLFPDFSIFIHFKFSVFDLLVWLEYFLNFFLRLLNSPIFLFPRQVNDILVECGILKLQLPFMTCGCIYTLFQLHGLQMNSLIPVFQHHFDMQGARNIKTCNRRLISNIPRT